MEKSLSKIQKINLREVWSHEALDFTNWLAKDENLDLLSEEVGVNIKLIRTEANVGKFNVDILAKEESTDKLIVIENQLEATNHDHLGKIITYASGYDAEFIFWIVKDVREEHQKAIEWLNDHTDENINFFLIRIELWRIDSSNPAPKFEIVASPNEWAKTIKSKPCFGELTDIKLQQLKFWDKFKEYVRSRDFSIRLQRPRPQSWYDITIGNPEAHIVLMINSREDFFSCGLYIDDHKDLFHYLMAKQDAISDALGEKIDGKAAQKASRIWVKKKVDGVFDEAQQEAYFAWLYEKVILFQKIFPGFIDEFMRSKML